MPPIRVVPDTNTVVSGLFWQGPPRQILDLARAGRIHVFTSAELLAELDDVLRRPKFEQRLQAASVSVNELVVGYGSLANLVETLPFLPAVLSDPDDDAVLACAVAAAVDRVVSGDSHLLNLGEYERISILTAAQLVADLADQAVAESAQ